MFDAKSLLNMVLGAGQQSGGLGGVVGQVLGGLQGKAQDAAQGAQNAAGGMQANLGDAINQAKQAIQTGNYAGLADQAKSMLQGNAGGILAGGLAGLALGTKSGRSILGTAVKLGGVALIGGLAYKAYQNYSQGKPLTSLGEPVAAAPQGSGFAEGDGDDNARALLMLRSMIAAAAADGVIDDTERARILGNLKQAGLDDEAASFIDEEMANPLDAAGLAGLSSSAETSAQIYTAARLAIDPDMADEQSFLADLAGGLELDAELVAHIDAAAASVMDSQPA
jgi:uncharacterized membrane protein YebE (DUF533 family)